MTDECPPSYGRIEMKVTGPTGLVRYILLPKATLSMAPLIEPGKEIWLAPGVTTREADRILGFSISGEALPNPNGADVVERSAMAESLQPFSEWLPSELPE